MVLLLTTFWKRTQKKQTRSHRKNVCARIPLQLAQEMETLGSMLDLNKREIITMALIDFLDKARDTLTEFKAWPDDVEEGK